MKQIVALQKTEKHLDFRTGDSDFLCRHDGFRCGILAAKSVAEFFLQPEIQALLTLSGCEIQRDSLEIFLEFQEKMLGAVDGCKIMGEMESFGKFKVASLPVLGKIIDDFQDARKPLVGFLFSRTKVRRIARRLTDEFDHRSAVDAHKDIERLRRAEQGFRDAISDLKRINITAEAEIDVAFYQLMHDIKISRDALKELSEAYAELVDALQNDENGFFAEISISNHDLSALGTNKGPEVRTRLTRLANHLKNFEEICQMFRAIPEINYAEELRDLEHLHTRRLADTLDGRVVAFANEKRNKQRK